MKTMTCNQLGGACDKQFQAETFEEMAELSMLHGKEMFLQNDEAHIKAMEAMKEQMKDPAAMQAWMEARKNEFESLPDDQ